MGSYRRKTENAKGTLNIRSICPDRRKECNYNTNNCTKSIKTTRVIIRGFYHLFVLLFVNWLYSCYKTPWWWSLKWPKHVGEEQQYWMSIFMCVHLLVYHIRLPHNLHLLSNTFAYVRHNHQLFVSSSFCNC